MGQHTLDTTHRRRPWVAVILSLMISGLGQVYCGRIVRGLVLFLLGNVLGVVFTVTVLFKQTSWSPYVLLAWFVTLNAVWLYAVVDAWMLARRSGSSYSLKDYNRWYVYIVLALLWVPSSFNYSILIREGLYEAFLVAAESMAPTLALNERVLADKLVYRTEPIRRGDIVVFVNPNNRHQHWIKRIVALAGDTIEMKDGRLSVNGELLMCTSAETEQGPSAAESGLFREANGESTYLILAGDAGQASTAQCDFPITRIPPGHCFVLGDNRCRSRDSRHVGPIPLVDIVGRVDLAYFPGIRRLRE